MFDYQVYEKVPDALSFSEALALYQRIAPDEHRTDEDFQLLWGSLIDAATNYINMRNRWVAMPQAQRVAVDANRSKKHNAYMSALTPLARYMRAQGQDGDWLEALGDKATHRKRWGDFAGYLLLFGALQGR